jgi:hypothetical protein
VVRASAGPDTLCDVLKPSAVAVVLILVVNAVMSCSSNTGAARGEACTRSLECVAGLACVKGTCGTDLSSIADMNTVPQLMPDADAGMVAMDGAVPDASIDDDAGN